MRFCTASFRTHKYSPPPLMLPELSLWALYMQVLRASLKSHSLLHWWATTQVLIMFRPGGFCQLLTRWEDLVSSWQRHLGQNVLLVSILLAVLPLLSNLLLVSKACLPHTLSFLDYNLALYMWCRTGSLLHKGAGSDGLLSVIAATGVHIKSINVQDVSIRSCFSTGTGSYWLDWEKN